LSADASVNVDAAVAERSAAPARRACVVMLGGRPYAVDITDAREVVVLDVTTPVPGAPASLVGVMNLRGSVLPVVEARPLLGLPVRAAIGRPRALVLANADLRAAILIERVLGLTVFDTVTSPDDGVARGAFAVGELVDEAGERATVLDAASLLAAVRRAWDPLNDVSCAVPSTPEPAGPARPSGA
jgi:purine-binding chemotaxis protein CheW